MHVMLVGGIAGMMLAVMTRATRGHTGRALAASRWTVAAYACLFGAALARPAADLLGAPLLLEAAGGLWIAAFGLFLAEYGPMLLRDRRPRAALRFRSGVDALSGGISRPGWRPCPSSTKAC